MPTLRLSERSSDDTTAESSSLLDVEREVTGNVDLCWSKEVSAVKAEREANKRTNTHTIKRTIHTYSQPAVAREKVGRDRRQRERSK